MSSKRIFLFLIPVVVVLAIGAYWLLGSQSVDTYEVIFRIGEENRVNAEFKKGGFGEQLGYTCTIGVDFSNDTFPARHYRAHFDDGYRDLGVENIEIIFTLDKNYRNIIFRLARSGSETTTVIIDDEYDYVVTTDMLGSSDNTGYGSYDLGLGALKKGTHSLLLTVADDGNGNGAYSWDALSLYNSPA